MRLEKLGLAAGALQPSLRTPENDAELEALFSAALEGRLPRQRELKPYEPQTLNERHLAIVMARHAGFKQRQIAQVFGATETNISIIVNHPDAQYILARLSARRGGEETPIQRRLAELNEPALDAIEAVFDPELEIDPVKRANMGFKVLEANGHFRPKKVEHEHNVQLKGSEQHLGLLAAALQESRALPEPIIMEFDPETKTFYAPGSGVEGSSRPETLPSDTGAPSPSGSQEQPSAEEGS